MNDKPKLAAGCLTLALLFAFVPPVAFVAIKYVVACWRIIGPLE